MNDCIFCKIVKGEISSKKIFENEFVLAFLDISEDTFGHTLVIPKKHFINVFDCDEKVLCEVIKVVKKIANHYKNNCGFSGVNIMNASDKDAQQSVFHLHFHIIPRKENDGLIVWPKFENLKRNLDLEKMQLQLK